MLRLCRPFGSVTSIKTFAQKSTPPKPEKSKEQFMFPRPHPIKMTEEVSDVISYNIPNRPLTPLHEIPIEATLSIFPYFESPPGSKVTKVSVLGPVNAGKSSLLNKLIGSPVTIVSRKAHTTRKNYTVGKTEGNTQLLFYDTPGVVSTHEPRAKSIITLGWESIGNADVTMFVVDAVKRLQEDVLAAASRLQKMLSEEANEDEVPEAQLEGETASQAKARSKPKLPKIPAILVMNKVDLVLDRNHVRGVVKELFEYANFSEVFYVSATTGYNLDKLENHLKELAKEDDFEFHPLQTSDTADIEKVEDAVRCHLFDLYHDELPYSWMVRTVGWTPHLDGTLRIDVDIYVHTEVQKGILIGKQSKAISKLWQEVQADLVKLYMRPIQLVIRGKLMKEFTSKEVNRGVDMSSYRNTRLTSKTQNLPPRLKELISPPPEE